MRQNTHIRVCIKIVQITKTTNNPYVSQSNIKWNNLAVEYYSAVKRNTPLASCAHMGEYQKHIVDLRSKAKKTPYGMIQLTQSSKTGKTKKILGWRKSNFVDSKIHLCTSYCLKLRRILQSLVFRNYISKPHFFFLSHEIMMHCTIVGDLGSMKYGR